MSENILEIKNLSKYFGGLAAVSNCSLKIKQGTITGIIGPNGSGKTTLFNLIAGNLRSSGGSVLFNNENITDVPSYELLNVLSNWLIRKKTNKLDAQKYVTLLYSALAELALLKSSKPLKNLVNEQTPGGLNWQGVNELRKSGYYRLLEKSLIKIYKRL